MKAFITSVGETTTAICADQLQKLGFKTCILGGKESWVNKYEKFIEMASKFDTLCVRVDADVIVNKEFSPAKLEQDLKDWDKEIMLQYSTYDFYKNSVGITSPVLYRPEALKIIVQNMDKIDSRRPETSAWRLPQINPRTGTIDRVVGMHGFFQDRETMDRAKRNKENRRQMADYNFPLVEEL